MPFVLALVDLFAQGAPVTMQLDAGAVVMRGLLGAAGVLLGLVVWFLRRLIGGVDLLGKKVSAMNGEVRKVSQELFGPNGENGMRSEVKRMSRQLTKHDRLLVELAVRADIDVPAEEDAA